MDIIVRGSTADFQFQKPKEITDIQNMWVTFANRSGKELLTLRYSDFTDDGETLYHRLTQEETLRLEVGLCDLQWKFYLNDEAAPTTYPMERVLVVRALKPEVIDSSN